MIINEAGSINEEMKHGLESSIDILKIYRITPQFNYMERLFYFRNSFISISFLLLLEQTSI